MDAQWQCERALGTSDNESRWPTRKHHMRDMCSRSKLPGAAIRDQHPHSLPRNPHHHRRNPMHETGENPLRLVYKFDHREALHDLFPQDRQLQLRQTIANTPMDAEPEGQMLARPGTIDNETISILDRVAVTVAGNIPHRQFVARPDRLAAKLIVLQRGPPHVA